MTTSGSTGEPLQYYNSKKCVEWEKAFYIRHLINNGYVFGEDAIYVRTYIPKENEPIYYYDHYRRIFWFSAYHMNEKNLVSYINEINNSKIKTLIGYSTSLAILAHYMNVNDIRIDMETIIDSLNSTPELMAKNRRIKIIFTQQSYVDGNAPFKTPEKLR